jgi:hypothetical protein
MGWYRARAIELDHKFVSGYLAHNEILTGRARCQILDTCLSTLNRCRCFKPAQAGDVGPENVVRRNHGSATSAGYLAASRHCCRGGGNFGKTQNAKTVQYCTISKKQREGNPLSPIAQLAIQDSDNLPVAAKP